MRDEDSRTPGLHRFVGAVQVFAGRLPSVVVGELPTLVAEPLSYIPSDSSPERQRIIRDVLIEVVFRVEKQIAHEHASAPWRRLLPSFYNSALDLRSLWRQYMLALQQRVLVEKCDEGSDRRVRAAIDVIWTNYAQPLLSLADVAAKVRLSKWHLERLLRRETGQCFVAHLNEARLYAACSLLLTDSLSAKEIAAMVGYGSLTVMDRQFKRHFASTPSKWREARRNEYVLTGSPVIVRA